MVAKSRMRTVSSVSVWRSGYHVHELLRANWGGTLKERDRNRLFSLGVIAASSPKPLASRPFMQIRSCRQIDEWGNHQDSQEGMGNALEIVCPLKHDYILSQIILVDTPEGA